MSQLAPPEEADQEEEEDEDIQADVRRAQMRARDLMEPAPPKRAAVPTADLLSIGQDASSSGKPQAGNTGAAKAPEPPPAPMHLGGAPQVLLGALSYCLD